MAFLKTIRGIGDMNSEQKKYIGDHEGCVLAYTKDHSFVVYPSGNALAMGWAGHMHYHALFGKTPKEKVFKKVISIRRGESKKQFYVRSLKEAGISVPKIKKLMIKYRD